MKEAKWQLRNPHGQLTSKKYEFDRFPWRFFEGSEYIYVAAFTSEAGMDSEAITQQLNTLLSRLHNALAGEPDDVHIAIHLQNETAPRIGGEEELVALAKDKTSPWYWDGAFAVFNFLNTQMLLRPESDGTEIGVYIVGRKAEEIYSKMITL